MLLDGVCTESYNADRLSDGLDEWRALAARVPLGRRIDRRYGLRHVWPRPPLFRCQRDKARVPDPARAADTEHRAELERGADRSAADRALRRQARRAQPRCHALGPDPLLGEGH